MKKQKRTKSKYVPLTDEHLWLLRDIIILIRTGLLRGAFSQAVSVENSEELCARITKVLNKQVGDFFTLNLSRITHRYSLDRKFLEDLKKSLNQFTQLKGPGFDYRGSEYDRRLAQRVLASLEHIIL